MNYGGNLSVIIVDLGEDELFLEKHRLNERRADSFAEQQARHAKETIENFQTIGESLLPCVQGQCLLSKALD